ncbi:MAG TPA: serine protease [Candidatus Nealsonbacteria bacterium]|uniref:Serine protease n=1 Tax=marine sediment metagenome TaxID=412755 RepID=A0A0F9S6A9_9ZZZZ|nr:serine protease [Candidatus Nealsonbacteria bacterium]HEB46200.1 serine protease [Candidatus Nealsonbacteria bacterium]
MKKSILKVFFILITGALGGMIFQAFILPYLATKEYFKQFEFVKILTEREVNLYPKETVIVRENKALQEAVERVERSVIGVRAQSKQGVILEGSGLILTTEGHVVVLGDLLPKGYDFSFFWEGEELPFEVLGVDKTGSLVKIKVEKTNLPTLPFADTERIKIGQRVFLVGIVFENGKAKKIVNEGIIKTFDEDFIRTNIFEKSSLAGSPLFDIEGNVLGLNTIDKEGKVIAISAKRIQEFTGF